MLRVTANIDQVHRKMDSHARQIPFALSKTINSLADQVQKHVTTELLPQKFTVRSEWWKPSMKFGFRVRKSTKAKLVATVGSAADWLPRQEEGGVKTTEGHRIAIPTPFWKKREEIMRREKKPKAILAGKVAKKLARAEKRHASLVAAAAEERKVMAAAKRLERLRVQQAVISSLGSTPFEATINGKAGIWARTSSGLRMLFKLQPSAKIKPRFDFVQTESDLVVSAANQTFSQEFKAAIATAR